MEETSIDLIEPEKKNKVKRIIFPRKERRKSSSILTVLGSIP